MEPINQAPVQTPTQTKSNKKFIIPIIALSIVAAALAGFIIYDQFIKTDNPQTDPDQTANCPPQEDQTDPTDQGGPTDQTTTTQGGPHIQDNYFIIPEWGVKYKLSDELERYSYAVKDYGSLIAISFTARIKGSSDYDSEENYIDNRYADILQCQLGNIGRLHKSLENKTDELIMQVGDYNIYYSSPQGPCTYDITDGSYEKEEGQVVGILKTILRNPERI